MSGTQAIVSYSKRAVFVSYASEDSEKASRIATVLKASAIEVWFDKADLRGSEAWDRRIKQQIRDVVRVERDSLAPQ